MKAIVYSHYGEPDVLHLQEVEQPVPGDNEVLVKMRASSINDWDWGLLRGKPFMNRLLFGLFGPKYNILGSDIAGQVEVAGKEISKFKPGDDVFGDLSGLRWGGFAEYICVPEDRLFLKPSSMSFEQAAAMPQAAGLAVQALLHKQPVQPGQRVLVNGAGGGSGSFAIQIAKQMGAVVTGVDNTAKLDSMRALGADHVVDYTREDFTENGQQYDRIIDLMGYHRLLDYRRALAPRGRYIMVGGGSALIIKALLFSPLLSLFGDKRFGILAHVPNKGLDRVISLFEQGKVVPTIDSTFKLEQTADAFRQFGYGHPKGKVVVSVSPG